MRDKFNQCLFIIIPLFVTGLFVLVLLESLQMKKYEKIFTFLNKEVYVSINVGNKLQADAVLNGVEKIYKEYAELTNKYKESKSIKNLYYINYNTSKDNELIIDKRLYQLIEYGIDVYEFTKGKIDISKGNIYDVWKSYRDSKFAIPTIDELELVNTQNIEDVELIKKNKIVNNNVNIDLNSFIKGYVTELAANYIEKEGISSYIINTGDNIIVGSDKDKTYSIGLQNPDDELSMFKVIYGNNISVSTTGYTYYEWNGKRYSNIINSETLFPYENMKSVTVICTSSKFANILSNYLFTMSVEDGVKYVNNFEGIEAIWYTLDNNIVSSNGISKYEK